MRNVRGLTDNRKQVPDRDKAALAELEHVHYSATNF
jgi:hypothetical protein